MSKIKSAVSYNTDSHGIVEEPNLHDAEIIDIVVRNNGDELNLEIRLTTSENEMYRFCFKKCLKIDLFKFRSQNVISLVEIFETQDILDSSVMILNDFRFDSPTEEKYILDLIRESHITRVGIIPSNGVEIVIYCSEILLYKEA